MAAMALRLRGSLNRPPARRGIALLSALALLAVFAIITTTYLLSLTLQEQASVSFRESAVASEGSVSGAEIILAGLLLDLLGPDGVPYSGDETSAYDSLRSRGMRGVREHLQENQLVDALRWVRPIASDESRAPEIAEAEDLLDPIWYMPRGLDEDPPGDISAQIGLDRVLGEREPGPGIPGYDDDGDGLIDEDVFGVSKWLSLEPGNRRINPRYVTAYDDDDDEDGRIDEDPGLMWHEEDVPGAGPGQRRWVRLGWLRDTSDPGGQKRPGSYSENYGIDDDADRVGVFDESARLHLNVAGNRDGRVSEGLSPYEADLRLLLLARGFPAGEVARLTDAFFRYRLLDDAPGEPDVDDNGNDDPGRAYWGFNGLDDDGDGVVDDADEVADEGQVYAGPLAAADWAEVDLDPGPGERLTALIPGDGLDNDGDGLVDNDDPDEAIDDFAEFHPDFDRRLDRVERLREVEGFRLQDPSQLEDDAIPVPISPYPNFNVLRELVTVSSLSPQVSVSLIQGRTLQPTGALRTGTLQTGGSGAERFRRNPNLVNQYSLAALAEQFKTPENRLRYLLPFQLDNDGDWDPRFDDWDRNGIPSGDFDGGGEGNDNGLDDDGDGIIDDNGDGSMDGEVDYDPEWHVNEDPWGDQTINALEPGGTGGSDTLSGWGVPGYANWDDDGDGFADFNDPEVRAAMQDPGSDGIDNDGDGLIDEGLDTNGDGTLDIRGGEIYVPAFDDDEDGRWDEDPPEFTLLANLFTSINQPRYSLSLANVIGGQRGNPVEIWEPVSIGKSEGEGASLVTGKNLFPTSYIGIGQLRQPILSPLDDINPPPGTEAPRGRTISNLYDTEDPNNSITLEEPKRELRNFRGPQPIRINEVMAQPVVVLEAETADAFEVLQGTAVGAGRDEGDYRDPNDPYRRSENRIFDSHWDWTDPNSYNDFFQNAMAPYYADEERKTFGAIRLTRRGGVVPLASLNTVSDASGAFFQVRNHPAPVYFPDPTDLGITAPRAREAEVARWTFYGVPPGTYNAIYVVGQDDHRPVRTLGNRAVWIRVGVNARPDGPSLSQFEIDDPANQPYGTNRRYLLNTPVVVGSNGVVTVEVKVPEDFGELNNPNAPNDPRSYTPADFSFDRLELVNINAQYVELINTSNQAVNLKGWGLSREPAMEGGDRIILDDDLILPPDDPTTAHPENLVVLIPDTNGTNNVFLPQYGINYEGTFDAPGNTPDLAGVYTNALGLAEGGINTKAVRMLLNPDRPMRFVQLGSDLRLDPTGSFKLRLHAPPDPDTAGVFVERGTLGPVVDEAVVSTAIHGQAYLGFAAQERRDPLESRVTSRLVKDTSTQTANDYMVLTEFAVPWGTLYARDAVVEGNEYEVLGKSNNQTPDQRWNIESLNSVAVASDPTRETPQPGMYFSREPNGGYTRFSWPDSGRMFYRENLVYLVRVWGAPGYAVGEPGLEVVESQQRRRPPSSALVNLGLDLEDQLLPDLPNNGGRPFTITSGTGRRLRAPVGHGAVVFLWDTRADAGLETPPDLSITFWHTQPGEYVFDRIELCAVPAVTLRGQLALGESIPRLGGTPGQHNLMYLPHRLPGDTRARLIADPAFDDQVRYLPLALRDLRDWPSGGVEPTGLQVQHVYGQRTGRLPSPGYLLRLHAPSGQPFERLDLNQTSDWLRLLSTHPVRTNPVPGLVNINTAPLEVLVSLPFAPLRYTYDGQVDDSFYGVAKPALVPVLKENDPSRQDETRLAFNDVVARHVLLGRQLKGPDGGFGVAGVNDDNDRTDQGQELIDEPDEYNWYGSDDGPYEDGADLLRLLTSRPLAEDICGITPLFNQGQDFVSVFWPQFAALEPEAKVQAVRREMQIVFARVANMITVHSGVINVIARGRVLETARDEEGRIVGEPIRAERVVDVLVDRTVPRD